MANFEFTKGTDWNSTPAYGTGEAMQIAPGGYVCKIKSARSEQGKDGRAFMVLAFDIAEGEQAGFYDKQFKTRKQNNANAKWGGTYRQSVHTANGGTNPFFKGFITSLEKSNNTTLPNRFTDKDLENKLFGGVFGREEFKTNDGEKKWSTKLVGIRSVEAIRKGDFTIPEDKPLQESTNTTDFYTAATVGNDEDLPF